VSGRIGASYTNIATGHRVPFYFLAYVGGMDTIRSFSEFRLKDENSDFTPPNRQSCDPAHVIHSSSRRFSQMP
jgi:hypothetical protein